MNMTKKQLAALNRIIKREDQKYGVSGTHPSGKRFAVTDSAMACLFIEPPEGIQESERIDGLEKTVQDFVDNTDGFIVESPPSEDDCRRVIQAWRKTPKASRPALPRIDVSTVDDFGNTISGTYDARKLLDALEVLGKNRIIYLGVRELSSLRYTISFTGLTAYRTENGDPDWNQPVFILPIRHETQIEEGEN